MVILPPFCHTDFLMSMYFHTKRQNKAMGDSPDIFDRCYYQISSIFYVSLSIPLTKDKKAELLFDLDLGLFDAENIDIALTETAETSFVASILKC